MSAVRFVRRRAKTVNIVIGRARRTCRSACAGDLIERRAAAGAEKCWERPANRLAIIKSSPAFAENHRTKWPLRSAGAAFECAGAASELAAGDRYCLPAANRVARKQAIGWQLCYGGGGGAQTRARQGHKGAGQALVHMDLTLCAAIKRAAAGRGRRFYWTHFCGAIESRARPKISQSSGAATDNGAAAVALGG